MLLNYLQKRITLDFHLLFGYNFPCVFMQMHDGAAKKERSISAFLFYLVKTINLHFEKPTLQLFQHTSKSPVFLHLRQWRIEKQGGSLAQVRYAVKPRNPE